MKFNRLGAFTLGVVITAVSVGAVSFVNAAGNGTLKACANKKTGVMRYISKGSCNKKTETLLSWNQMGPQGLTGTVGMPGPGGENGKNGRDGGGLRAVDATGKNLGLVIDFDREHVTTFLNGVKWRLLLATSNGAQGSTTSEGGFIDSSCAQPVLTATNSDNGYLVPSSQVVARIGNDFFRPTASVYGLWNDLSKPVYLLNNGICVLSTLQERSNAWDSQSALFRVERITPPTYVAPVSIIEG
jgi:hypothetical protein